MGLVRTVDPVVEPITLDEAKTQLEIDSSWRDVFITALITASRMWCENWTRRSFITQTWTLTLDEFPSVSDVVLPIGSERYLEAFSGYRRGIIYLDRAPLQAVQSIKYTDQAGNTGITLDPSVYQVEAGSGCEARVQPSYAMSWPPTRIQMETVQIIYTAGYGDAEANVPQPIKQAMLLQLATFFSMRESVALTAVKGKMDLPEVASVKALLDPYQLWRSG